MSAVKLGWGHININVTSLDDSIAFYEKLGFTPLIPGVPYLGINSEVPAEIPAPMTTALGITEASRARACIMELDGGFPKIDLTEYDKDSQQPPGKNDDLGAVRICLASNDLAADYAKLVEAGVEFITPPTEGHGGLADIAVCMDPDGTLIEIIQIYLEKWTAQ